MENLASAANREDGGDERILFRRLTNDVVRLMHEKGIGALLAQLLAAWILRTRPTMQTSNPDAFEALFINMIDAFVAIVLRAQKYDLTKTTREPATFKNLHNLRISWEMEGRSVDSVGLELAFRVMKILNNKGIGDDVLLHQLDMLSTLFERLNIPLSYIIYLPHGDLILLRDFFNLVPLLEDDDEADNGKGDGDNDGTAPNGKGPLHPRSLFGPIG